jgi:hypothetical protein
MGAANSHEFAVVSAGKFTQELILCGYSTFTSERHPRGRTLEQGITFKANQKKEMNRNRHRQTPAKEHLITA